jgi:hypothetical protein
MLSSVTLDAEQKFARLARDGAAAEHALPAVQEGVQRCTERVAQLCTAPAIRLYNRAAVEAAAAYARQIWLVAMTQAVLASVPLESLKDELMAIGHLGTETDPATLSAAVRLAEAAVPRKPGAGASGPGRGARAVWPICARRLP